MSTITFPVAAAQAVIGIILTEGLTTIKDSLTRDKVSLSNGYSHYSELHGIYDDLNYLLKDPLGYVQDIVGYFEDLRLEEELNDIEKAIVFLGENQDRYEEVNDLLKHMLPEITEYKVLKEQTSKALGNH